VMTESNDGFQVTSEPMIIDSVPNNLASGTIADSLQPIVDEETESPSNIEPPEPIQQNVSDSFPATPTSTSNAGPADSNPQDTPYKFSILHHAGMSSCVMYETF